MNKKLKVRNVLVATHNVPFSLFKKKKKKENGEFQESDSFAISHEGNNLSEVLDHLCDFL